MRAIWARSGAWAAGSVLLLVLAACGDDSPMRVSVAPPPGAASAPPPAASAKASSGSAGQRSAGQRSAGPSTGPAAPSSAGGSPTSRAVAASSAGATPAGTSGGVPVGSPKALPSASRLQIPSIGVDAPIVTLGVDPDGTMQVPNNGTDVGWYAFSAVPGSAGNAVLSGHLDTATSRTAVFTRLKDLKLGDPLDVLENGRKMDFEVFWTKSWPDDTAPLALILGNAPSPTLTLITCSGVFDRATRNYSERLVIRAKVPGTV